MKVLWRVLAQCGVRLADQQIPLQGLCDAHQPIALGFEHRGTQLLHGHDLYLARQGRHQRFKALRNGGQSRF
ncbi:hypothetical protein D3C72_1787650 [compost metagenome]